MVLPFWSALVLVLMAGLLVVCISYLVDRLEYVTEEIMNIDSTLGDLQPLVEEGRAMSRLNAEKELDHYMSQEAEAEEEDPTTSPER